MALKSKRRSVSGVIAHSKARPETDWSKVSRRSTLNSDAYDAAESCRALLKDGATLNQLWRFGVLQTLDYYNSAKKVGGVQLASQVFVREPALTGSSEIDAAFAALADYLATRDGWPTPQWANNPSRSTSRWYAAQSAGFYEQADRESPSEFRSRGVYIAGNDLSRA